MTDGLGTVLDKLQAGQGDLTRAERQLADAIRDDYPISGLGSITELAARADVSTPTVARMVQKLGYSGYPAFQAALRRELQAMISDPQRKHERLGTDLPEEHILRRFTEAAGDNLNRTLDTVDPAEFDAFCAAIGDRRRKIHIAGGRLSGTMAQYLFQHLQMIRPGVTLVPTHANVWPHYILDVVEGDVLIAFDIRRYENSTLALAEMAHERGAQIALFTDQWRSPIHRLATQIFASRIAVPSAWDSALAPLLLIECAIAAVQERHWETIKSRTEDLETAFDRSRLFRKFV